MEFGFDDSLLRLQASVANAHAHRQGSSTLTGILATSGCSGAR
jgi:hypothetical protein